MKDLDITLDNVENARFSYIYSPFIALAKKDPECIFSDNELMSIALIYHKFVLANGPKSKYMTKFQLSNIMDIFFEIEDRNIVSSLVFRLCQHTSDNPSDFLPEKHVSLESFFKLFTIYFTRDLEIKMKFTFSVYDRADTGQLNGEEVSFHLDKLFENFEDEEEAMELRMVSGLNTCFITSITLFPQDLKELFFQKFDKDKDGNIQAEEYYEVVRSQPMMLECFGRVFPATPRMDVLALCANVMSWFEDSPNPRIMNQHQSILTDS
ncbi:hypothetical protein KR009_003921 [Drosophila setifemur]|nr:hypothetical protein KR009_003921 [Drosophila setifemur]